ncbi:hypothetical protein R6Q59_000236 [Mikania micrantha]
MMGIKNAGLLSTARSVWDSFDFVYDVSSYLEEHPGGYDVLLQVTDATDEFEDAGHSKTPRELMETFCVGELDTSNIPRLEVVSEEHRNYIPEKLLDMSKQYWAAPVAAVGLSVLALILTLVNI